MKDRAPPPPPPLPRLAEIIGQERAIALLERALATSRLPHALLFDGPDGVGKRTTALALGLALACTTKPRIGCGGCAACIRVASGNHPDVRVFSPPGAQILIEQAQEIVALASERPHEAAARIVIVDPADRLNPTAANCLLKTLEEPAPGNHVVLVTAAPDRLLGTIRSRAQRIRFATIPMGVLVPWLRARGIEPAKAEVAAALADGSLARALDLVAGDRHDALWQIVGKLRAAAAEKDVASVMQTAAAFSKDDRQQLGDALAVFARLYRDVLVTAAGAPDLAVLGERRTDIDGLATRARSSDTLAGARKALSAVVEASDALAANVNPTTALEMLMFRLRGFERAPLAGAPPLSSDRPSR